MADAPYLAESWSGLIQFRCPACGYDTFLQARIDAHMAQCPRYQASLHTEGLRAGEPPAPPPPEPEPEPEPDEEPVPAQPTPARA